MKRIVKIAKLTMRRIVKIANFVPKLIPDTFIIVGLGLLGYGLWLYTPWLGLAVTGALLLILGIAMGLNETEGE